MLYQLNILVRKPFDRLFIKAKCSLCYQSYSLIIMAFSFSGSWSPRELFAVVSPREFPCGEIHCISLKISLRQGNGSSSCTVRGKRSGPVRITGESKKQNLMCVWTCVQGRPVYIDRPGFLDVEKIMKAGVTTDDFLRKHVRDMEVRAHSGHICLGLQKGFRV